MLFTRVTSGPLRQPTAEPGRDLELGAGEALQTNVASSTSHFERPSKRRPVAEVGSSVRPLRHLTVDAPTNDI